MGNEMNTALENLIVEGKIKFPESKEKFIKKIEEVKKYTKKELEEMTFLELKKIGEKFGTTDRSKVNLIKEILELQ